MQPCASLAVNRGESLSTLSPRIGRNGPYLHQFVTRGTPAKLDEDDRLVLAEHYLIDERLLGARDAWTPRVDA